MTFESITDLTLQGIESQCC